MVVRNKTICSGYELCRELAQGYKTVDWAALGSEDDALSAEPC